MNRSPETHTWIVRSRLCFSITSSRYRAETRDLPAVMLRRCFETSGATVGQECPTYSGRRMGILARRSMGILARRSMGILGRRRDPRLKQLLKHKLPNVMLRHNLLNKEHT